MSKFEYKAEGELNSQYMLDLINDYTQKLLKANDTAGINEGDFKINTKASGFVRAFNNFKSRLGLCLKGHKANLENYNKTLTTQYLYEIQDKIKIFLQTNVLEPKEVFDIIQTLNAIKFSKVVPEINDKRYRAIKLSENKFLKVRNDIKYLKNAITNYVLFTSPVNDIKPFLSDEVSLHKVDVEDINQIFKMFINLKHKELTTFNFEEYTPKFEAKLVDFYKEMLTSNGVGEDVEKYIREKMLNKLSISEDQTLLMEDKQDKISQIDVWLKRIKLYKLQQMMIEFANLKYNQAQVKEVIDDCKEKIKNSTIEGKDKIFLVMDASYYALSNKCDKLANKVKLKLQLVDKIKLFDLIARLQDIDKGVYAKSKKPIIKAADQEETGDSQDNNIKPDDNNDNLSNQNLGIADNLYDDEEQLHITEEESDNVPHEDEVVIEESEE